MPSRYAWARARLCGSGCRRRSWSAASALVRAVIRSAVLLVTRTLPAAPAAVSVVTGSVTAWKASSTSSSACPGWSHPGERPQRVVDERRLVVEPRLGELGGVGRRHGRRLGGEHQHGEGPPALLVVGGGHGGTDQTVEGGGPARHVHRLAQPDLEAAGERVDLVVGYCTAPLDDPGDPFAGLGAQRVDDAASGGRVDAAQQVGRLAVDAHRPGLVAHQDQGDLGGLHRLGRGEQTATYLRGRREQAYPEARLGGRVLEVLQQERGAVGIRGVLEQPDDVRVDLRRRVIQRPPGHGGERRRAARMGGEAHQGLVAQRELEPDVH